MDTGRTAFILIYCLLFITNKSSATEEPNANAKPGPTAASTSKPLDNSPGSSKTTNPPGGSAVEAKVGSTSAPLATSPPGKSASAPLAPSPPGKSASAPLAPSPPGKSASASPAIQNPPGKSASASPTTQKPPEGSTLPPAEGGRSASGSKATPTLPEESAGKSAATVDPKATQPAKLSPPTGIPKSGKSDDNITNETGKMHGSAGEPSTPKPDTPDNKKYFWILLPVGVAFLAVAMYFRYKFFKVHHHPETTDNGTENASFQRTESNRDGVTLLGVKSSGTEEGAAA